LYEFNWNSKLCFFAGWGGALILRLACPACRKDSYSVSAEAFRPCPYCGLLFSGRYGSERRRDDRVAMEMPLFFSYKGRRLIGSTLNFSGKGLSVKISGEPSLPVGDTVELSIGDSLLKAQILWAHDNPEAASWVTGLKILEGDIGSTQP
jgi:hypothetical protein